MWRQHAVMLWFGAFALAAHGETPPAPDFPGKPLTLVVGFAAGGGIDINARLLAGKLSQSTGQPVIVENRPGAGSRVASEYVKKAAPDGHTLLVATAAVAIDMAFRERAGVQTLRDFVPISTIASSPMILVVNPSLPVKVGLPPGWDVCRAHPEG